MRAELLALFPEGVVGAETFDLAGAEPPLEEERELVARAVPKRVQEFAAGRQCARQALSQLGIAPQPLLAVERAVQWPEGVVGSITHTDHFAAAVAAPSARFAGVGIDVEQKDRVQPRLWKQIAVPEEVAWLQQDPSLAELHGTILFSAKEAFYKAQYCISQAWVGFKDVVLRVGDGTFVVELTTDVERLAPSGTTFEGRYAVVGGLVVTGLACLHPR